MLDTILSKLPYIAAGVGLAIAALKLIAPLTKTKVDDDILSALEKAAPYLTEDELAKLKNAIK